MYQCDASSFHSVFLFCFLNFIFIFVFFRRNRMDLCIVLASVCFFFCDRHLFSGLYLVWLKNGTARMLLHQCIADVGSNDAFRVLVFQRSYREKFQRIQSVVMYLQTSHRRIFPTHTLYRLPVAPVHRNFVVDIYKWLDICTPDQKKKIKHFKNKAAKKNKTLWGLFSFVRSIQK